MSVRRYDVIVIGASVAGAATAMLLARSGLRVLAVDHARFPSDTLSSHQIHVPGIGRLRRWGLLDAIEASGAPPTRRVRFDPGSVSMEGRFPEYDNVDALNSPRRTVLDTLLIDAARGAGAEVRDGFHVEELVWSEGRVIGIRGRERGTAVEVAETARLVVGADGKRSFVAKSVDAGQYRTSLAMSVVCYTYWSDVPIVAGELYQRPGRAVAVFPTNDDLTMVYVAAPIAELPRLCVDTTTHYLDSLDRCADLGDRVRQGRRAERFRIAPDLPNTFRVPHGPGWALVGDAGVVMDPVTAQGITHAFADAERLAAAVTAGLDGSVGLGSELARYHRRRDSALNPMYDLTLRLAQLRPLRTERHVLESVARRQRDVDRLAGVFAGVVPASEFRSWRTFGRRLHAAGRPIIHLATSTIPVAPGGAVEVVTRPRHARPPNSATTPRTRHPLSPQQPQPSQHKPGHPRKPENAQVRTGTVGAGLTDLPPTTPVTRGFCLSQSLRPPPEAHRAYRVLGGVSDPPPCAVDLSRFLDTNMSTDAIYQADRELPPQSSRRPGRRRPSRSGASAKPGARRRAGGACGPRVGSLELSTPIQCRPVWSGRVERRASGLPAQGLCSFSELEVVTWVVGR